MQDQPTMMSMLNRPEDLVPLGSEQRNLPALRQYIRIALRWRSVIGGIVAGCMVLGLIVTLLMTPQYTASTTLEISRESAKITDIQGVERDANIADQEFYQTQYGLLQSRTLSERVATHLGLVDDPTFFAQFKVRSKSPAFQVVGGRFPPEGRKERQRVAGQVLLKATSIVPTRLSRLVLINTTAPDPQLSARVANTWASDFIQVTLERRFQATLYARKFLEQRLEQLRQKLEESERQLVAYASAQRIINLPGGTAADGSRLPDRSVDADDLIALDAALSQATADRVKAQARYEQTGASGANTEALANPAINALRQKRAELAAEYQRLMVQFEPGYPAAKAVQAQLQQIDRALAREEGRISGALAADYKAAVDRENALRTRVGGLKTNILDLRRRSIQYNIFQREVDTNRQLYDGLLQRYKEIGVAGGVGVNNVSVVDIADVPVKPSSPRLMLNLSLTLLAGLVLGGLAAFALEQMEEAISDPSEIKGELGLALLGTVPRSVHEDPIDALDDRRSPVVEAYLAVQTNLQFSTSHGVPTSMMVTSTRPSEGKSTTALALATMLSRAHKKVVLIDGDLRSPSVHYFADRPNVQGLSNYLSGEDDVESLLVPVEPLGFIAMLAGPIPPNAAELLTGPRMTTLLKQLAGAFDHIIIDAPPVMGLADAPLLAGQIEGVIYVVEAHQTRTSMARTALSRLLSANAHIIGGVLTKFESRRGQAGYGYEYGYDYGSEGRAEKRRPFRK